MKGLSRLILYLAFITFDATGQDKHPATLDDLFRLATISDVKISGDGVVYPFDPNPVVNWIFYFHFYQKKRDGYAGKIKDADHACPHRR